MMTLKANTAKLNEITQAYVRASGKTVPEVIAKMARKLGVLVYGKLRYLAAPSGTIKASLLERIKGGKFITIRPGAYEFAAQKLGSNAAKLAERQKAAWIGGKSVRTRSGPGWKNNIQALAVQREINMRASARGFTGQTARFTLPDNATLNTQSLARSGKALAQYTYTSNGAETIARFGWGTLTNNLAAQAAEAVGTDKAQGAINAAIEETIADTLQYHRFSEDFRDAFLAEMK